MLIVHESLLLFCLVCIYTREQSADRFLVAVECYLTRDIWVLGKEFIFSSNAQKDRVIHLQVLLMVIRDLSLLSTTNKKGVY